MLYHNNNHGHQELPGHYQQPSHLHPYSTAEPSLQALVQDETVALTKSTCREVNAPQCRHLLPYTRRHVDYRFEVSRPLNFCSLSGGIGECPTLILSTSGAFDSSGTGLMSVVLVCTYICSGKARHACLTAILVPLGIRNLQAASHALPRNPRADVAVSWHTAASEPVFSLENLRDNGRDPALLDLHCQPIVYDGISQPLSLSLCLPLIRIGGRSRAA